MFLQNESKLGPFCMCHPSKHMVYFYLEGYNWLCQHKCVHNKSRVTINIIYSLESRSCKGDFSGHHLYTESLAGLLYWPKTVVWISRRCLHKSILINMCGWGLFCIVAIVRLCPDTIQLSEPWSCEHIHAQCYILSNMWNTVSKNTLSSMYT